MEADCKNPQGRKGQLPQPEQILFGLDAVDHEVPYLNGGNIAHFFEGHSVYLIGLDALKVVRVFEEYVQQLSASLHYALFEVVHASSEESCECLVSDVVVVDVDGPHFAGELALL